MQFLGHVATGALASAGGARLRSMRPGFVWALLPGALGGITPDLVDKAILTLEVSRYGRTVGHSLLFLGLILAGWGGVRGLRGATAAAPLGFWVLGVATHLMADLLDDGLRGLLHGGQTFYTYFAWPFVSPYAWVVRNPHPLGGWPWAVTPLEVVVWLAAFAWLPLAVRRARRAGLPAGVIPESTGRP